MKMRRNIALLIAVVLTSLTLSFATGISSAAAQDDDATPEVGTPLPGTPEPEPTEDTSVTLLPSTGAGDSDSSMISYAVIIAGAALVALAAMSTVRSRSQR